jgi:cob(I)alamin adenosyltransferase
MKIYTKTGDDGSTGLFGGQRVQKDDLRVAAYGSVDELNSALGVARAAGPANQPEAVTAGVDDLLAQLQADLFVLGADLATPRGREKEANYLPRVDGAMVEKLEMHIDSFEEKLPALKKFILPGGSPLGSALHFSRTICRRAERATVTLGDSEDIGSTPIQYLNRLADLLFVLARYANQVAGMPETEWAPKDK